MKLRDYQINGRDKLRDAYRNGKTAPLFVMPTGAGKTALMSEIAKGVSERGKPACILVHRAELIRQTSRALERIGVPHGIIAPRFTPSKAAVQIASVQTLTRHLHKHHFEFLFIDEAHHATAGSWRKIVDAYPNAKRLGVTATPCRLDGTALRDVFDEMVEGPSISELIERGFLTKPSVYAPQISANFGNVHMNKGDFDQKEVEAIMRDPAITGDAVSHYRRIADGLPALAFCVSIAHAKAVAASFCQAGYRATSIDGSDSAQHREGAISDLASGALDVITSCSIISEGTDIPRASVAILLRPTMSVSLYLQQVGRVLRPVYADGMPLETDDDRLTAISKGEKPRAIILDHVGNTYRFGLATEDRDWSLEEDQPKPKKDAHKAGRVRGCVRCGALVASVGICEECGEELPKAVQKEIETRDGELEEVSVSPGMAAARKVRKQLDQIARQRGYKPGWAWQMQNKRNAVGYFHAIDMDVVDRLTGNELFEYLTGQKRTRAA